MRSIIAPLLALAVTAGTLTAVGQTRSQSSSRSKTESAEKEKSKYHRLPTYYGKLNLKEEQVEEIYAIKDDYGPQIDELKQELADLQKEMNEAVEDVLTSSQKSELEDLRDAASKSRSASRSSSSSRSRSRSSSEKED